MGAKGGVRPPPPPPPPPPPADVLRGSCGHAAGQLELQQRCQHLPYIKSDKRISKRHTASAVTPHTWHNQTKAYSMCRTQRLQRHCNNSPAQCQRLATTINTSVLHHINHHNNTNDISDTWNANSYHATVQLNVCTHSLATPLCGITTNAQRVWGETPADPRSSAPRCLHLFHRLQRQSHMLHGWPMARRRQSCPPHRRLWSQQRHNMQPHC